MTLDEVKRIMGTPAGNAGDSTRLIWIYLEGTVQFKDGKAILLSANDVK